MFRRIRGFYAQSSLSRSRPEVRGCFVLVLGFGLLFTFVNPPFAVNDEDVHLSRIYELTHGRLLTQSDADGQYHDVPGDYPNLAAEYYLAHQLPGGRINTRKVWLQLGAARATQLVRVKGRAGAYPPVLYAPQIAALWFIRHFDVGGLVHLYVVRIASLLTYAWLASLALRRSPLFAWPLAATALTPMALTQAASASGDGLLIGLSLLFFALLSKGACTDHGLTRGELAELVLSVALLTVCKPVYGVFVICLPALRLGGARSHLWRLAFTLGATLLAAGGYGFWAYLNRNMMGPPETIYSPAQQLSALREHPLRPFTVAFRTLLREGDELFLQSFVLRNQLSRVVRFTAAIAGVLQLQLCAGLALGTLKRVFPASERARQLRAVLFIACWGAVVLAVAAALYLCCTRIGALETRRLQGRYFIPALPALWLGLSLLGSPLIARWLRARAGAKVFAVLCFTNLLCLSGIIGFHYFPRDFGWPF